MQPCNLCYRLLQFLPRWSLIYGNMYPDMMYFVGGISKHKLLAYRYPFTVFLLAIMDSHRWDCMSNQVFIKLFIFLQNKK